MIFLLCMLSCVPTIGAVLSGAGRMRHTDGAGLFLDVHKKA